MATVRTGQLSNFFIECILKAFRDHQNGKRNRLRFNQIELLKALRERNCRHPPRVFARCRIDILSHGKKIQLHYLTNYGKDFVLAKLADWKSFEGYSQQPSELGSPMPFVRSQYQVGKILRALLKLAINLLAAYCPN